MERAQEVLGAVAAVILVFCVLRLLARKRLRLPPGPPQWPIIGNLKQLGKAPHKSLAELAKKYGPVMFLKLGSIPTVVISSKEMAKEFLQTQGELFASRCDSIQGRILSYDRQGLTHSPYGPKVQQMRKILTMELLSPKRLQQFQIVRKEEILVTVQNILEEGGGGQAVEINMKALETTNNIITRMMFTKTYCGLKAETENDANDAREFQELILQSTELFLAFFIGNFIPYLERLDPSGLKPKLTKLRQRWDEFLNKIIGEHRVDQRQGTTSRIQDFVDVLLATEDSSNGGLTEMQMRALLKESILAGSDASATHISWTLVELVRHPEIQRKLHEELDSVVGRDRLVEESDVPNLSYLQAIVKESFRVHPTLPLLVPHESTNTKPVQVAGYDIPPHSRLLVNISAIHNDPSQWVDPEKFDPERFVNSTIDTKGQHFQLLPFGSGRRGCPGLGLGLVMVQATVAQLLHAFEWRLADGTDPKVLNDLEIFRSIVGPKSIPYNISSRLPLSVIKSKSASTKI